MSECATWPMDPACATEEWDAYDTDIQDRALALASVTLERLTGGRVKNCPTTIRPCTVGAAMRCDNWWAGASYGFSAINWGGTWRNIACQPPACVSSCEVQLPGPVGSVPQVKVDGAVLDPDTYRVDENLLVWKGPGDCPWNFSQDLSKDDTEPGTFSVTYLRGYPVDSLGAYAVGVLALEFAKGCAGDTCELPDNVTTIVRQGITLEVVSGSFPNGETGLRAVDNYIGLWNPGHLRQAPAVWSPDILPPRVTQ